MVGNGEPPLVSWGKNLKNDWVWMVWRTYLEIACGKGGVILRVGEFEKR